MIDSKKIEQLARQVHEAMPKGIRDLGDDVEKKIRQVLQAQLTRMELVNREEFDVQTQVLIRTREKLAALEQRIAQLENPSTSSAPVATAAPATATTATATTTPAPATAATAPVTAPKPVHEPAAKPEEPKQ